MLNVELFADPKGSTEVFIVDYISINFLKNLLDISIIKWATYQNLNKIKIVKTVLSCNGVVFDLLLLKSEI